MKKRFQLRTNEILKLKVQRDYLSDNINKINIFDMNYLKKVRRVKSNSKEH